MNKWESLRTKTKWKIVYGPKMRFSPFSYSYVAENMKNAKLQVASKKKSIADEAGAVLQGKLKQLASSQ